MPDGVDKLALTVSAGFAVFGIGMYNGFHSVKTVVGILEHPEISSIFLVRNILNGFFYG